MQNLMLKLDRWLRRRRWFLIGAWLVLVVAAVPLAAKQSEHLSGGGYSDPRLRLAEGADVAARDRTRGPTGATAGACWHRTGTPAQRRCKRPSPGWAQRESGAAHVSISPTVRAQTLRAIQAAGTHQRTLVVPLDLTVNEEGATNVASKLRENARPERP